jgi:hypothetical protein
MRKIALLLGCVLLTVAARRRVVSPPPAPPAIDIMRSMVIVDPNILQAFDFQRVLQTLVDRSGATATTPLSLYQQWFDTQNPKPGLAVANAPHCDDFVTDGKPSFNGFERRCPTSEGMLAKTDPFAGHDYTAIGITNRFDLTPVDGSNCGQYRIIYAKTAPQEGSLKLHVIFEAVLPNPWPQLGTAGCRAAAQYWADLSTIDSVTERRARVERFFFDGVDGYEPVLMPSHFAPETGRIRTSQLSPVNPFPRFYQFNLQRDGARLLVVPGLLADMPFSLLYNATLPDPRGTEFQQLLVSQVATLAARGDFNAFFDNVPDKFLMHESNSRDDFRTWDLADGVIPVQDTAEEKAFKDAITAELHRIGSNLTANQIITRNGLLSCHGCHNGGAQLSVGDGVFFPTSFADFAHIDEGFGGGGGFQISPGLRNGFAPARAKILRDFLFGNPLPVHSNGTLGGGRASD